MAKRGRKILKSTRKKQPDKSLLSHSSTDTTECAQINTVTTPPSLERGCSCRSKFANLLSSQTFDESTNDGFDITWIDQSRQLCICQRDHACSCHWFGQCLAHLYYQTQLTDHNNVESLLSNSHFYRSQGNPINQFEEILNSVPSVDSPVSRQVKLSLGHLIPSGNDDNETRLKRRSQKQDLNSLQVLLQEVKSPLHQRQVHSNSKSDIINRQSPATHHDTQSQESDNVLDILFSDSTILDDLTFSPLPDSHTTPPIDCNANSIQASRRQIVTPLSSAIRTPFRKPVALRKRLVQVPSKRQNDESSTININDYDTAQIELSSKENSQCENKNGICLEEEDLFWTQVANTVTDSTTSCTDNIINYNSDSIISFNDHDVTLDDSIVEELFKNDDFELPQQQSPAVVYSQQDILTKRDLAKRKLLQKFKSI